MTLKTLLLSFLTTCTTHSAVAQTLGGVEYSPKATTFHITTSPDVKKVNVLLSDTDSDNPTEQLTKQMKRVGAGKWELTVKSDLKGKYYLFSVYNSAQPDNTPGIFAKAVGVNGKRGAIVDLRDTDPEGWADDVRPALNNPCDLVIYEMHHRDFSVDLSSGLKHKGKYLALTEPKAIEHLQRLGVNAVHILPSFDYASVDESKPDVPQYNWGYDPLNYNVPEGSYSTDAATPTTRIREFKQMVQALHRAGIRVILDVVYNHTFDINGSNFQKTYPDYFYRKTAEGKYSDGSGCGNETASEKPLMREFMKESVEYWIKEYHIDGFRFDLMGVHDIETMNEIRAMVDQIDPSIYIYGEGWSAGSCAYPQEKLAMKANTKQLNGIGAFCDDMRDALRGPFSDDHKGGFLIGEPDQEESIKFGIVGAIAHPQIDMTKVNYSREAWTNEPSQMVAYVSCHDDMCLTDRLRATVPYITDDELIRLDLLAQTAVLTSQGVPFILSGEEMLRDKKSVHNSFRSPDSINRLDWNNLKRYPQVFDYYAGLIALRKAHPAFRMGKAEEVRKHLEFVDAPKGVVAFRLKDNAGGDAWRNIYVVLNSQKTPQNVTVAEGSYTTVVANGKVNADGLGLISGTTLTVAPQSALIVHD
ncbi:type I pullulanase [Leyella stercorea]|uniref:Pullulanase type I n=1 Tax=Leyella stercorea CAG:629 TaxID=1263103 RepID=R7GXB0_9BACT|nr:type I pullulanase [Leyella stercorea]CDE31368.1 pullulanase type I [Leyella stercorea CAG:629]